MALAQFAGGRAASRARHCADARRETHKKLATAAAISDRERQESQRAVLEKLEPTDYLQRLGYQHNTDDLPLKIAVQGHREECKCTYYDLQCTLGSRGQAGYASWRCRKRLCYLREELHDPIKEALGPVYAGRFEETPFAKFGGLPGTTARLVEWFRTLADMINAGYVAPPIVALVLQFLCAPCPRKRALSESVPEPPQSCHADVQ